MIPIVLVTKKKMSAAIQVLIGVSILVLTCKSDSSCEVGNALSELNNALNKLLGNQSCQSNGVSIALMQLLVTQQLLSGSATRQTCKDDDIISLNDRMARLESKMDSIIDQLQNFTATQESFIDNITSDISNIRTSIKKCTVKSSSCADIKANDPSSKSGYYDIINENDTIESVYCYMEELCNSTEGWTRVAHLDMRDSSESCPSGFKLYSSNGVRACGRPTSNKGSCVGTAFTSNDIEYTEVCGKVIGYQVGWTDGSFVHKGDFDKVRITHGNNRKPVWLFLPGTYKNNYHPNCPCGNGVRYNGYADTSKLASIGSDYYCESGYSGSSSTLQHGKFYNESLWDGKGCGTTEVACCQRPGMPWFHKLFNYSTTDYIELSICLSEATSDEDIAIEQYELYVK